MCDTLIALGNATNDGSVIFAKNSDREPNEAHQLLYVPAADHAENSLLECTYRSIPQVRHTHAVLLAKPFWIWGAEMGANEQGVVIGNEALFTRVAYEKEAGLIGMDFLRLALERADTARQALDTIVQLLAQYGQGGNCGFTHPFYYHNSFLIGDSHEAWVLETAGRQWAAERVTDIRSISNAITIGAEWDLASDGLVDYALERGWCRKRSEFDFARCYSDPLYTYFSAARSRQACTTQALRRQKGKIEPGMVMDFLRLHTSRPVDSSLAGAEVCMHVGAGPVRINQSVGSMVSQIRTGESGIHWLTGTSAPCTSLFKPVWMDAGLPQAGSAPTGFYDEDSLFWKHEVLHRTVLQDYSVRLERFQAERDELEKSWIKTAEECRNSSPQERLKFSQQCFHQEETATGRWIEQVKSMPVERKNALYYRLAWNSFNRQAKYPRE